MTANKLILNCTNVAKVLLWPSLQYYYHIIFIPVELNFSTKQHLQLSGQMSGCDCTEGAAYYRESFTSKPWILLSAVVKFSQVSERRQTGQSFSVCFPPGLNIRYCCVSKTEFPVLAGTSLERCVRTKSTDRSPHTRMSKWTEQQKRKKVNSHTHAILNNLWLNL